MSLNRMIWIAIFIIGSLSFLLINWESDNTNVMAWFMLTSLWSAACAIAYTIIDWLLSR